MTKQTWKWWNSVNYWTRNKSIIGRRLFFAGGYPKWHWFPKTVKWGNMLSIYWLDTELVFAGKEKNTKMHKYKGRLHK